MSAIRFSPEPSEIQHAIVASFDLSDFSKFCLGPDAHAYLNRYLSYVFGAFETCFQDWWNEVFKDKDKFVPVQRPDFAKYTGDGALVLWLRSSGEDFSQEFCTSVVSSLRYFQRELPTKVADWERVWRAHRLPRFARIGITTGPVRPLATRSEATPVSNPQVVDYAGYCINLAIRLQNHSRRVGFLVHGPVRPQIDGLCQMEALKMKGSMKEPVYLFKEDFEMASKMAPKEIKSKFAAL
jgi:class 3 adenylate cyclase